ncbi:uncharacterized protein BP5553_03326 [Venustampulla echinocandica]|uniref:SET domain-containing protein n=1 Tax=Venustampulla echinocandica TaxID=2656787 RepID=A0A370TTY3_9HELO|nr:uncharacterized protein BP5553_03326 [Venustampulla echinocandica]RDL38986.1 hypothetical protein BP5553_03326 [Venustampulla echinocandica]
MLAGVPGMAEEIQEEETLLKSPTTSPLTYEVKLSPGKGLGVFAVQHLHRGTKIIIEAPLVSVPVPKMVPGQGFRILDMISSLETAYEVLSPKQQEEFLGLHDFRFPSEQDQNRLLTIFRSNAYNTGDSKVGLFPKIARINHSCSPNSGNWWSEKTDRRVIYAARDIEKGEEITVSYIPLLKTTKDRQARLEQYGFICDCAACQSSESDKRRTKIWDLLETLELKFRSPSKKTSTNDKRAAKAIHLVEMVEDEGLTDYLARAFHVAAVLSQQSGQLNAALEWAIKELEIHQLAEKASDEALKTVALIESLGGRRRP